MSEQKMQYPVLKDICQGITLMESALQTPMKNVVTVDVTDSLISAFRVLVENKILSAPVKDGGKWIGFLDVRDLASYVSNLYHNQQDKSPRSEKKNSGSVSPIAKELKRAVERQVFEQKRSHLDRIIDIAALEPSINVRYFARRNSFKPLPASATLWDAMELMAKNIKRIPVVNDKGKIVNIVSQSSVTRLISKRLNDSKLQAELSRVIADKVGTKKVVSVHKDTVAADVFKVMSDRNLSGIAVIDSLGGFLSSTNASDLKLYLIHEDINLLRMPIRGFLAQVRQEELLDLLPNVSVKPTDTLAHVVAKLAVVRMHRVFVADPKTGLKPTSVISISDLVRHFVAQEKCETMIKEKSPSVRKDGSPSLRPRRDPMKKQQIESLGPLS